MNNFYKWWQTIKIAWSNYLTYRFNFFLQIIGPSLVFFFIKYNLWSSIFSSSNGTQDVIIQGYSFEAMISYHAWSLVIALLAQGHSAHNLSEDIRLGRISTYLIYPFNFWEFHTASFLAFQGLQTLIAIVTISIIMAFGIFEAVSLQAILLGFFICFYISVFWFILQFFTGILGFWLEETWILRVTLQMITLFLSGAIIPLELYPERFVTILNYTPFPYLTYYPIKIFSGEFEHIWTCLIILGFWGAVICLVNNLIWKKGVRLYTAAGI